jgi:hypothetical protein
MNMNPTSERPTFDDAKARALALRHDIEKTLPSESVTVSSDADNLIPCDGPGDTGQYDGTRTIAVTDGFDRSAWIDSVAETFSAKGDWKVVKKVAADGSSDATSGLAVRSEEGYYVRIDGVSDAGQGAPAIIISASSPCATL